MWLELLRPYEAYLPILSSCCISKGNAEEDGVIVEIEKTLNSRLLESHSWWCWVLALYSNTDAKQKADQPVD